MDIKSGRFVKKHAARAKAGSHAFARESISGTCVLAPALIAKAPSKGAIKFHITKTYQAKQIKTVVAHRIIQPGTIVLNNAERDRFLDAIENPAAPSEDLLVAAAKYGYR